VPRFAEIPRIFRDLDRPIWLDLASSRSANVAPGFLHTGLSSHVLLAACGASELASEVDGRGLFTTALLEVLTTMGAGRITYADLLRKINIRGQNPQCEGNNRDRIFFQPRSSPVRMDGRNSQHMVLNKVLPVVETNAMSTVVDFLFNVPQFAPRQAKAMPKEPFRIHVATDEKLTGVYEALLREIQSEGPEKSMALVDKEDADLDISLDDNCVNFNILSKLVTQFGLTQMPFTIPAHVGFVSQVSYVVRAAVHYHSCLRHGGETPILQNQVRIEFTKVKGEKVDGSNDFHPIIPYGDNLNCNGVVDLVLDDEDDTMYGIKITNNTNLSLYPSLFFFDNSDLSITSYYQPPVAGNFTVDPPLRPMTSLAIYSSGGPPHSYFLRDGQDVDVGFLKLFLSTHPVDLSDIEQASPFKDDGRHGGMRRVSSKPVLTWDSMCIAVVQRRRLLSNSG